MIPFCFSGGLMKRINLFEPHTKVFRATFGFVLGVACSSA